MMKIKDGLRFLSKIEITGSCWLWKGATLKGHSQIHYNGKTIYAHRMSYEMFKGEIPEGMQIDHLCRVRHCVNPNHLEVVNNRTNSYRGYSFAGINHRKTHCAKGHEYSEENTTHRKNGRRVCKQCKKIWDKQRYDRLKLK